MAISYTGDAATTRSNLGLGSLSTKSSVGAAEITDNSVGAAELNVSGNGTSGYALTSDGDGSFSWTEMSSGASTTFNDIGTYSTGTNQGTSTRGSTYSGSSIKLARFANADQPFGFLESAGSFSAVSSGLSGTWRAMQTASYRTGISNGQTVYVYSSNLFVRVS